MKLPQVQHVMHYYKKDNCLSSSKSKEQCEIFSILLSSIEAGAPLLARLVQIIVSCLQLSIPRGLPTLCPLLSDCESRDAGMWGRSTFHNRLDGRMSCQVWAEVEASGLLTSSSSWFSHSLLI